MIDLSSIDYIQLFIWCALIIVALFVLRLLWSWFDLVFKLFLAAVAGLFILDKLQGGTAIDQVVARLSDFIRSLISR